nr:MAG TPA_asm: hypothetical protein [Caudoviricetes sp.]
MQVDNSLSVKFFVQYAHGVRRTRWAHVLKKRGLNMARNSLRWLKCSVSAYRLTQ